ncbi:MAG: DUF502 domain-containing protein [bacterium]|nr:DUF502 domain-containing protein [Candidatus Sumerlaeota bacterium]
MNDQPQGSIFFTPIKPRSVAPAVMGHIRGKLFAGLITVTPIAVTVFICYWIFGMFAGADWLNELARIPWLGNKFVATLVALVCTVGIIYLIGLLSTTFLIRRSISLTDAILARIPIVKLLYNTSKQLIDTLNQPSTGTVERKVVVVEYPRRGCYGVGFVTGESQADDVLYVRVFIPMQMVPPAGWLLYFRSDEVWETNYTVEEAMKLIISGGIMGHPAFERRPYAPSFMPANSQTKPGNA